MLCYFVGVKPEMQLGRPMRWYPLLSNCELLFQRSACSSGRLEPLSSLDKSFEVRFADDVWTVDCIVVFIWLKLYFEVMTLTSLLGVLTST
jgi:hypothetical protein